VAGKRRDYDYGKIAENLALLGAQVSGYAVPIKPALDLVRALRRQGPSADDEAFVEHLLVQIDLWRRDHADQVAAVGGMPSLWEERLLAKVASKLPAGSAATTQLLATAVFDSSLMASSEARLEAVAGQLAADLPELIVRAGDPYGVFAAIRALFAGDLAGLEAKLDRLDPETTPAVADALVAGYLARLLDTLDRDTWSPRERDDNSLPVSLTTVQQTLLLERGAPQRDEPHVPLHDLAESCDRLVILGGPGTGKTWAARRIAIQCAEQATAHLGAGKPLQSIELPFFATCSEVLEKGESSHWGRLINATLNWADDAPGDRPTLVRVLGRHDKRLVVLDGLDEATGLEDRALHALLSARSSGATRLVLTSRVGSWNTGFLHLEPRNERHVVGDLQPFTPADTIAAARAWLEDAPAARRARVLEFLRDSNSALSRQASVPLLCAMFCLVARQDLNRDGDDHFDLFQPGRRLDLYDTVIDKLLRATWRGITPAPTDGNLDDILEDALAWLEDLAVDGNIDDPAGTGLGKWPDVVQPTRRLPSGTARYVDHVAPPARRHRGRGRQGRRFVHHSLREHLTAKALCRQPAAELAETLVQHLWFDAAWQEVLPNVIVGHENADDLVERLFGLADSAASPDPTYAFDKALLKAAAITRHHADGFARRDLLIERAIHSALERIAPSEWGIHLGDAAHWPATDTARIRLVELLDDPQIRPLSAAGLARSLVALGPTGAQAQRAAELVLERLARADLNSDTAARLADVLVALAPICSQPQQLGERVVERLAGTNLDSGAAAGLAEALAPTSAQAQTGAELVELLTGTHLSPPVAAGLARALVALEPTGALAQQLAEQVVERLTGVDLDSGTVARLGEVLVALAAACSQPQQLAERLVEHLAVTGNDVLAAAKVAEALVALGPSGAQAQRGAELVVERLAGANLNSETAGRLREVLLALSPTCSQPQQLAERLVEQLARVVEQVAGTSNDVLAARKFGRALVALGPSGAQAQRGAELVLERLAGGELNSETADWLVEALQALAPICSQPQQLAERLVEQLTRELEPLAGITLHLWARGRFAEALVALGPSGAQAQRGAELVLERLAGGELNSETADWLVEALQALAPICSQPQQLAERLVEELAWVVERLAGADLDSASTAWLAKALVTLVPACSQPQQVAERLVEELAWVVERLAGADLDSASTAGPAKALAAPGPTGAQSQRGAEPVVERPAGSDANQWGATAAGLAAALVAVGPSAQVGRGAELVLERLAGADPLRGWAGLAEASAAVVPACSQPQQLAERLVEQLTRVLEQPAGPGLNPSGFRESASALVALAPICSPPQPLAERVLERLASADLDAGAAASLADALVALAPTGAQAQRGAKLLVERAGLNLLPYTHIQFGRALVALALICSEPQQLAEQVVERLTGGDLGPEADARLGEALVALAPICSQPQQLAQWLVDLARTDPNVTATAGLYNALGELRRCLDYESWRTALSRRQLQPEDPSTKGSG
jgi:hypothetical protein